MIPTEWRDFADRVQQTAIRMFQKLDLPLEAGNKGEVALCLLARTISNFDSAMTLLKIDRIVEARILMRCCWENTFYIAKLAQDGETFIKLMIDDEMASKKARGERLLQQRLLEQGEETTRELRAFLKTLGEKGRTLNPKGIADSSALSSGYIIYLTASADAAHPTITALGRHLPEDKTGFSQELHIVAPVEDEEALMTVDFLCGALVGACYGVGEVLGGSPVAPEVKARAEEYQQIKGVIAQRLNS